MLVAVVVVEAATVSGVVDVVVGVVSGVVADVSGIEVVVVEEVVGRVEVDVEVAMVVSMLGAAGRLCVSLVVVVSGNAGEAVPAFCAVGVVSDLSPSWLSFSLDEHAAASRITATHTARMFLNTSFLTDSMYYSDLSGIPQRKHRFSSLKKMRLCHSDPRRL